MRAAFNNVQKISPVLSVKLLYWKITKKRLNLVKPKTFDEKIQWLKFYWQDPLVVKCGDKYTVRDYVREKGLDNILTKLYGSYDMPNELEYEKYPQKYVIKTSNSCKTIIIVDEKNGIDKKEIEKKLRTWQKLDYSKMSIEPHYAKMYPKIIVEEFLDDGTGIFPIDYKIFCFNGEPKFIEVMTDRTENHKIKRHFYDLNWVPLDYEKVKKNKVLEKPARLSEFINISKKLSEDFPFVRVDLYNLKDRIILGELTFTPSSGIATYYNEETQKELGSMIDLPKEKKIGFK